VAVTVQELPTVVLDEGDRIVGVNSAASPWFGAFVGEVVFDCYPDGEQLFRPYFERARRTGRTIEFPQFYDGTVAHVTATPGRTTLTISWEVIDVLDTFTLDGLRASLDRILAGLDGARIALERERVRDSLRVVAGGA
jgi:hypothetical protein